MAYQIEAKILSCSKEIGVERYDLMFDTGYGVGKLVVTPQAAINIAMRTTGKKTKGGSAEKGIIESLIGKKLVLVIQ